MVRLNHSLRIPHSQSMLVPYLCTNPPPLPPIFGDRDGIPEVDAGEEVTISYGLSEVTCDIYVLCL
jgi:hypothetical protein